MDLNRSLDFSVLLDKQKIIFPIITLVITLIISTNIYKIRKSELESFKQQMEEEERLNELIKRIKIQEKKFSGYKRTFGLKDASFIMQEISKFAAESDIKMVSFNPLKTVISEALMTLPFNLKVEGAYHEIGNFISKIESSADILEFVSVKLSRKSGWSSRSEKEELIANIVIKAVFLAE